MPRPFRDLCGVSELHRGFYWPQIEKYLFDCREEWDGSCERHIQKVKHLIFHHHKGPRIVAIYFLTLGIPSVSYQYALVATDLFT